MNHNKEVRTLQVVNHVLAAMGLLYVALTGQYGYLLVSLLFYWITGVLGINVGMHRLLAHRSFKTFPWMEKFLSLVAVITSVGSPLAWVTIHRQHHKSSERLGDPHSPYMLGNWKAWFGFWNYIHLDLTLIKDLRKSRFQRFLHKHYLAIIAGYVLALMLVDPMWIYFAYAIPACLCLHSTSAIIVIAHRHGYRTHQTPDESRNSWIANLITLGEGWHNNHHASPGAWSNWEKWWEWDIPSLVIRCIKKD